MWCRDRHSLVRASGRAGHDQGCTHAHTIGQQRSRQCCTCARNLIFEAPGRDTIPCVATWVWADWGRLVSGHHLCVTIGVRRCGLTPGHDMIVRVPTGVAVAVATWLFVSRPESLTVA